MADTSPFDGAVDNRGLFADHYLEERFPERDDVKALRDEADAAFEKVRTLYRDVAGEVDTWNEAQTEDRFVQPVLKEVLGWARKVQPHVQRQGRVGRPDYALFTSEDRRTRAVQRAGDDENKVFDVADAVADAKYWGRPLDGTVPDPDRKKTAEMRRNNPSFQIIDYVTLTGVEWGILTNGVRWRLYYEGAPSRLETYFEVNLPEIVHLAEGDEDDRETARAAFRLFYALFRADAHRPTVEGETFVEVVYEASDTYAEALEETLKERVYDHVFLELATGLYENHHRKNGTAEPEAVLDEVYRATLRLLYRLLFLLYAESRGLLPLDHPGYYEHSLSHLAERAKQDMESGRTLSAKHPDFWNDLDGLFRTIDEGDPTLDVPAYNGGLFRQDHDANAFLESHEIGHRYVARALTALTAVDPAHDPTGPSVDYKSLDVRQLGSIYEGLLEHRLVVTDGGELDLQTDEGERKETGSYYTPHYVVEYIVEETLGPIVEERIERFEAAMAEIQELHDQYSQHSPGRRAKLDQPRRNALEALLTVRVCDPAMGSGHFLVYAADYLAERFAQVLGRYPDHNPVTERLDEIRQSILDELERQGVDTGGLGDDNRLRDTSLLKRLVMKRCIYGVDLNPMAVELAKLSLWLHSFTVGAPLSFLDHHLKAGNSLIGTRVDTVVEEIQADLFGNVRDEILRGTKFLQDAAFNTDATLADVEQSAAAFRTYQDTMRPYKRLLDLWTAQHFGVENTKDLVFQSARDVIMAYQDGEEDSLAAEHDAVASTAELREEKQFFHWELEFPEVFYDLDSQDERDNPGFDAVVGNPPYVSVRELIDAAPDERSYFISSSTFTTAQHVWDLYMLMAERGYKLLAENGYLSFIVPVMFLHQQNAEALRRLLMEDGTLIEVSDLSDLKVFADAIVKTAIFVFRKGKQDGSETALLKPSSESELGSNDSLIYQVSESELENTGNVAIRTDITPEIIPIVARIENVSLSLGEILYPTFGLRASPKEKGAGTKDRLIVESDEDEDAKPYLEGKNLSRYETRWPGGFILYRPDEMYSSRFPELFEHPKVLVRAVLADKNLIASVDEEDFYADQTLVCCARPEHVEERVDVSSISQTEYSLWYIAALINSALISLYFRSALVSDSLGGGAIHCTPGTTAQLPIREIDFTTPEDERERHAEALISDYEAARSNDEDPSDTDVLAAGEDRLGAESERSDVVHDFLAHLAREMTRLKEERHTYNLDVTDYVSVSSDGVGLREIGRYQPASGVTESLLADTTEERENLRIGRLEAERDGDTVHLRATARFKPKGDRESWPDAVPSDTEPDRWGYVETEPLPVCTLHDCTALEAGLIKHWLAALNEASRPLSGYRDTATKTISLLDRLYDARFPDPSDEAVQNALRPFLRNAQHAAELDRQIAFTDGLIDRVVYRLYGLSEEEVGVVEGNS